MKNSTHAWLARAVVMLAALAGGCANEKLPKAYLLEGMRVLALPAASPEVGPGESTTVSALVSDTASGGRILSYSAEQCRDPGVGLGAEPTCEGASDTTSLGGGSLDLSATTPPGLGSGATVTFNAPAASEFDDFAAADFHNGIPYLVIYRFTAGSETVTAFRRILVTSRASGQRNQNPGTFTLTGDGAALTGLPASASTLRATLDNAGDAETYTLKSRSGPDQTLTEEITFNWLVTGGTLDSYRTTSGNDNAFKPATTAPSPAALVVIARDNRGGVSFTKLP